MDVHIGGRESVASWKDFAVRYLLIVAGILSAWAVNQWNEARQHQRVAAQARTALRAELANNLKEVRSAIATNEQVLQASRPPRERLIEALKARRSDAEIESGMSAADTALRGEYPTLRRDAWEAAIAGQALAYLDADELQRYSAAYAAMRDVGSMGTAQVSGMVVELQRGFVTWSLNRRIGRSDYAELARLLLLWATVAQNNVQLLRSLDGAIATGLGEAPLPPAAPASAASR